MDLDVQENKSLNHDQNQNKLPQKKQNKTKNKTDKIFLSFFKFKHTDRNNFSL